MIPKIVHYVRLGPPLSPVRRECIATWEKFLPGWKIKEWNEKNSNLSHSFIREMLSRKLYAFASDLIRLEALLQQGGVYLDSDIKLIKKPEELFDRPFIASFISMQNRIAKNHIANGFIAATPGHVVTKELYEFFKKKKTASPATDAMKIFYKNGFSSLNNASPNLDFYEFHGIKIYHSDTFYPSFDKEKSEYITTRRTYGIHLSLNEWGDRQQFVQKKLTDYIFRRWDRKILRPIEQTIKKLTGKNKK